MTTSNFYFDDEPIQDKMPVFLKVLCILTFISCGFALITTIYGLATADNLRESVMAMQGMNVEGSGEMIEGMTKGMIANLDEMEKWTLYGHYLALGNIALTLSGALIMWKRKKAGFFIYLIGQLLPFVSFIGIFTAVKDVPIMGITMIIGALFSVIFAIAFIIMYALNLKHMS